jgi:hypothetical protein
MIEWHTVSGAGGIVMNGLIRRNLRFERLKELFDPSQWAQTYKKAGFETSNWIGVPAVKPGSARDGYLEEEVVVGENPSKLRFKNTLYVEFSFSEASSRLDRLAPRIDMTYRLAASKGDGPAALWEDAGHAVLYRQAAASGGKPEEWFLSITKTLHKKGDDPDLSYLAREWQKLLTALFVQADAKAR